MSDFIREVDEEYRQDRFREFLNRYWILIGLSVVLVLAGVGAWRGYQSLRQTQAEAAGARYFDALTAARSDAPASATALEALGREASGGYGLLARMRAASALGRTDPTAGIKAFDAIANDATVDPDFRDVARLRAAILAVDAVDPGDRGRRLEPMTDSNAIFRNEARELLAVAALKAGNDDAARRWLDAIEADPGAAADLRQRAALFLTLSRAGLPASKP